MIAYEKAQNIVFQIDEMKIAIAQVLLPVCVFTHVKKSPWLSSLERTIVMKLD